MKYIVHIFTLILCTLLVGCVGGNREPETSELTVNATEFEFTPDEVTVPAGSEVNITLVNDGQLTHDLTVMVLGYSTVPPFTDEDQENTLFTIRANAGETEQLTFEVPSEVGTYQIVSSLPGYLEAGMQASFIVE